jgi:hypothetical protein
MSRMYQVRVDRLRREIADLQAKAARARADATRERETAMRARSSITSTTSASTARSKLSDAQRRDQSAIGHERRAIGYDNDAVRKTRELTAAQQQVERARDEQDRRRRSDDLRRIAELEQTRRATQWVSPVTFIPHSAPAESATRSAARREYDVCLTFAGEERSYVEMVASGLKAAGLRVFYDQDEDVKVDLWGKDLAEHFDYIYRKASRYCVMFISQAYASKPWTRDERRSALARALAEEAEYISPARFDDTELDGLQPTVGYLDLGEIAPATLVEYIVKKLADGPWSPATPQTYATMTRLG